MGKLKFNESEDSITVKSDEGVINKISTGSYETYRKTAVWCPSDTDMRDVKERGEDIRENGDVYDLHNAFVEAAREEGCKSIGIDTSERKGQSLGRDYVHDNEDPTKIYEEDYLTSGN